MRIAAIAAAASVALLLFVLDGDQPARAGASLEGEIVVLTKAYAAQMPKSARHPQATATLSRGQRWLGAASKAQSGGDDELARRMLARARADLALARELSKLAVAHKKGMRLQHRLDDLHVAIKKLRGRVKARQEHIKMIKKMR